MAKELKEMGCESIGTIIDTLSETYSTYINERIPLKDFPAVMLWGQPGIGKSQSVWELQGLLKKNTKKRVVITDVRLLLFNPIDLRGIPVADVNKQFAIWLRPKIFDMNPSSDCINILFLDEISSAPQSVQSAAYQITLDRQIGEHKLPENCLIIAAGNRLTDKSVVYKMPKALSNRFLHFEVDIDFESWKKWAINHNINEKVLGFLSFRPELLNTFDSSNDSLVFATPRSWEIVSNILNNSKKDINSNALLIKGLISTGVYVEFLTYIKIYKNLPSIADILNGDKVEIPKDVSTLYALVSSITIAIINNIEDNFKVNNALQFIGDLPVEFKAKIIRDLMLCDAIINKLLLNPIFQEDYEQIEEFLCE
jgi:hypothetical protein